ncbi:MAG: hypothetical protein ACFE7R_04215 [Candidatus Hodarchaeota archaeon]
MSGKQIGGWYVFCGQRSHVPRGVPIFYGRDKEGGKIVEPIPDYEKPDGLTMFRMWETGLIEEGFEKHWEPIHYEISCSMALAMRTIARLCVQNVDHATLLSGIHTAVDKLSSKRPILFREPWLIFKGRFDLDLPLQRAVNYVCSRCGEAACLNRQTPFHDQKMFKKIIKRPELILAQKK